MCLGATVSHLSGWHRASPVNVALPIVCPCTALWQRSCLTKYSLLPTHSSFCCIGYSSADWRLYQAGLNQGTVNGAPLVQCITGAMHHWCSTRVSSPRPPCVGLIDLHWQKLPADSKTLLWLPTLSQILANIEEMHTYMLLREDPFSLTPPTFGHCPNSD